MITNIQTHGGADGNGFGNPHPGSTGRDVHQVGGQATVSLLGIRIEYSHAHRLAGGEARFTSAFHKQLFGTTGPT